MSGICWVVVHCCFYCQTGVLIRSLIINSCPWLSRRRDLSNSDPDTLPHRPLWEPHLWCFSAVPLLYIFSFFLYPVLQNLNTTSTTIWWHDTCKVGQFTVTYLTEPCRLQTCFSLAGMWMVRMSQKEGQWFSGRCIDWRRMLGLFNRCISGQTKFLTFMTRDTC